MTTVKELRSAAKANGIKGYSTMSKKQLVSALEALPSPSPSPSDEQEPLVDVEVKVENVPTKMGQSEVNGKKERKTNQWIQWVKKTAKEEGIPYSQALKMGDRYRKEKKAKS